MASIASLGGSREQVMAEGANLVLELTVGDDRPIVSQNGTSQTAIIGLGGTQARPESVFYVTPVRDEMAIGLEAWVAIVEGDRIFICDVYSQLPGGQLPVTVCWMQLELARR